MSTYLDNYERVLDQKAVGDGEEVRFLCPFPGCDGYNKRAFCVNIRTGFWACHHCQQQVEGKEYRSDGAAGHGGTAREFALMMGDDPAHWPTGEVEGVVKKVEPLTEAKRKQLWTRLFELCALSDEHRELLRQRGIDGDRAGYVSADAGTFTLLKSEVEPDLLIRGGLAYESSDGLRPRQCIQAGRILIPYREKEKVVYFVGYARCPEQRPNQTDAWYADLKSRWAKVAGPAGYTPKVYGTAPENAPYVIITEGQLKTEAARQRGFPCLGLSGIGMGHKVVARHCAKQGVRRAIVLFDTQLEDQLLVDHEAMRLAKELMKLGIPAYHAELPQEEGAEKTDIDSFLCHRTARQFAEVLAEAGRHPYELEPEPVPEGEGAEEECQI